MDIEKIAQQVVDAAISVHRELGPGLLESAYQFCLAEELRSRGFDVAIEVSLPITYKGQQLDCGYRIDMLVENQVLLELKAVEEITPVHLAQILTYLRLSNKTLGFLLNFNVRLMKKGIKRVALEHPESRLS